MLNQLNESQDIESALVIIQNTVKPLGMLRPGTAAKSVDPILEKLDFTHLRLVNDFFLHANDNFLPLSNPYVAKAVTGKLQAIVLICLQKYLVSYCKLMITDPAQFSTTVTQAPPSSGSAPEEESKESDFVAFT